MTQNCFPRLSRRCRAVKVKYPIGLVIRVYARVPCVLRRTFTEIKGTRGTGERKGGEGRGRRGRGGREAANATAASRAKDTSGELSDVGDTPVLFPDRLASWLTEQTFGRMACSVRDFSADFARTHIH